MAGFTANYNRFLLDLVDEYHDMKPDAQVYSHKLEPLFFPAYDPNEMPCIDSASHYRPHEHKEVYKAFRWRWVGTVHSPGNWESFYGHGL